MRPKLKILAALSVLGFLAHAASAEDITISTYYPSPYGSYQELETTGQTTLAATSGNVGIRKGTGVAPTSLLDIGNNTLPSNAIINVNAAANRRIGINLQSAGSATDSWFMYKPENSPDLNFWDGSANTVTFADGGNVGIGTTTPTAKLDVTGEVKIGNTNIACTPSSVGAIRYDPVSDALQYCADNSGSPVWKASGGSGGDSVKAKLISAGIAIPSSIPEGIICKHDGISGPFYFPLGASGPVAGACASCYFYSLSTVWVAFDQGTLRAVSSIGWNASNVCLSTSGTWISASSPTPLTDLQSF